MTSDDKYLTTQALDWFGGAHKRFWEWLFDDEDKRLTAIVSFILGAIIVRLEPDALFYAGTAVVAVFMLMFAISFLIPIVYLIEWGLRKATGH